MAKNEPSKILKPLFDQWLKEHPAVHLLPPILPWCKFLGYKSSFHQVRRRPEISLIHFGFNCPTQAT